MDAVSPGVAPAAASSATTKPAGAAAPATAQPSQSSPASSARPQPVPLANSLGARMTIPPFNPNLFPPPSAESAKPLWLLDEKGVDRWVRSIHALFPKKPKPAAAAAPAATKPTTGTRTPEQIKADVQRAEREAERKRKEAREVGAKYAKDVAVANRLTSNLTMALALAGAAADTKGKGKNKAGEGPAAKRAKIESSSPGETDLYKLLDSSFARGEDVVHLPGSVVTRLTLGGLTNALAGKVGGVVDVETCKPLADSVAANGAATNVGGAKAGTAAAGGKGGGEAGQDNPLPTASNLTLPQLLRYSRRLHTSIQSRVHLDMLSTTPSRIVEMLCPEVTPSEINMIRRRIYDTVVLGRGTGSSAAVQSLEEGSDAAVAARTGVHDIEKWKKCKVCGNNDQSSFVLDRKNGDLICTSCGTVATESLMHEGSAYRKFEGEADRNHHGDAANPLYSNAHNMSTTLGGVSFQTGAGMGGYGSQGGGRGIENVLRNAHAYTEMNISQFGKGEKKTRIGYKDRQKKDAFVQMNHVGDALSLHEAVVQRAKELFAGFRDDRELVQQFKGVIAGCLCEAFDQLSRDGRQILRQRAGDAGLDDAAADGGDDDDGDGVGSKAAVNARASRRDDLHSASFAGKGGLAIGTPPKAKVGESKDGGGNGRGAGANGGSSPSSAASSVEMKPAAAWDLDDCRSWLLEASRSIARQWVEQRNAAGEAQQQEDNSKGGEGGGGGATGAGGVGGGGVPGKTAIADVPKGSIDELEGKLVEHTLALCVLLESDLKGGGASGGSGAGRRHVVTPRAPDMGRLGIKWQHSHERGSGGKGGVGNSGRPVAGTKVGAVRGGGGRTAGQILILKTSKKLAIAINDPVAGEAFHRELRALLGRQETRKKKELSNEATMQRFKQMKRKPWLQARAQL